MRGGWFGCLLAHPQRTTALETSVPFACQRKKMVLPPPTFFLCPHQPVGSSCSRHVLVITYWCSCSHHSLVLVLHYLLIPLPDTSFLFSLFSEKGDRPPGSGGLFSRRVWFGRPEVRGFDGSVGEGQRTAVVLRTAINYTGNSPRVDILKNRE